MDSRNDGAGWCGALDENQLVFEIRFDLLDAWFWTLISLSLRFLMTQLFGVGRDRNESVPSTLVRDLDISLTQPSQVIGTAKVVYSRVSAEYWMDRGDID